MHLCALREVVVGADSTTTTTSILRPGQQTRAPCRYVTAPRRPGHLLLFQPPTLNLVLHSIANLDLTQAGHGTN